MKPPTDITVRADTREKDKALFTDPRAKDPVLPRTLHWQSAPKVSHILRVHVIEEKMPTGDYTIVGHEASSIAERKAGLREIRGYWMGRDQARCLGPGGQMDRLVSACRHPILVLDTPLTALADTRDMQYPEFVFDALMQWWITVPQVRVLWATPLRGMHGRRLLGEAIVRALWAAVWHDLKAGT